MNIILSLMVSLKVLIIQANPLHDQRLRNMLHSESVILTNEEAETLVNESKSYGTDCDR